MAYLTEADLENFILQDIDSSFSAQIVEIITWVEDYINNYCGIDFENSTAETKYFDGSGNEDLFIGEFQTGLLTEVLILDSDGNTLATLVKDTDYWEYPYDNASMKNTLRLIPGSQYTHWPLRNHSAKVTGKFGRSTVPKAIKLAAIKLAAKIINEGLRGGQVAGESLGAYSVTYEKIDESAESLGIKEILNQYREVRL